MLSIGKLVGGQERYYEQQIANGLDDYYAGRGEAPGRWCGAGAASLGLEGQVREGQLRALIAGRDPHSGDVLREHDTSVAALDLTFSAPKSVSVLFAVAAEPVSRALVECHDDAVQAALAYLEETAAFVRREQGGRRFERGGGFVTAAFRHRMSRALDPQLHTHCVTANLAKGPDARWTALHHPSLYRAAQTAGYLYQAHLRARVRERLGLEWGPLRKGAAELAAIDRRVVEEFSRRRHEMRRAAELGGGIGLDTKRRAESAAIATRDRKQFGVRTHTWREEVQARASEHGLDKGRVTNLLERGRRRVDRGPANAKGAETLREVDDALAGPAGLTEKANTFDERAVLRAHAQAARQGASVGQLRERAAGFASRGDVIHVRREAMTTAELVGIERALIASAHGRVGEGTARVDEPTAARALAVCEREMTSEQRAAVLAAVTSGDGVQVIEALAGTGKTYTAGVVAHVYRRAGYRVLGVAPTGRAVRELNDEAGIASCTLASIVLRIGNGAELPRGCVVILDEAGMAATRESAALLAAAQRARAKVVAIGDPGQLRSVQAGGWLRAVGRRVGVLKLSAVMRQRDHAERRALRLLHEGVPGGWLEWARTRRRVEFGGDGASLDAAVREWAAAARERGVRDAVLIARSNETRAALNDRARAVVRGWGALGDERVCGGVAIAVGDRIICRRNDREVDVDNGTRGTVRHVERARIVVETDARTVRELPAAYVANHVEHAYALTGHGMQGGTVEWAGVVAVPHELTRGWSYTALSRARGQTRLFVLDEGDGWAHHDQARRDELAPDERVETPTAKQLAARVERYMQTRDDEDLAVDRLPGATTASVHEAAAVEAKPEPGMPRVAELELLTERRDGLRAQLASLATLDVERLQAMARREQAVMAHADDMVARLRALPAPRKLRRDRYAAEREGLARAIAGADQEVHALRTLSLRLERETGPLTAVLSERARLRAALARAEAARSQLREQLVRERVAHPPDWARSLFGDPPANARGLRAYESAVATAVRYRLDHGITGDEPLGPVPDDPTSARLHRHATAGIERMQRRLMREQAPGRGHDIGR